MATKKQGKGSVVTHAKQLIAGASKHLTSTPQVLLLGGSFTPAQLSAQFQALVNARADVEAAKAQTKAKLAVEKAITPGIRILMDALGSFVKAAYGHAPDVLADFGLHPKAQTQLTVEAKTAAVAKRKATRAARHTAGPKQKKNVKGAVTGIVVTPVTATDHGAETTTTHAT